MSTNRIQSHEPGSPEWHEQRRLALGGSEVAAVLGISPFESRFSLWHRKAGLAQPIQDSPEMEWGRRLESAILERCVVGHHAPRRRSSRGSDDGGGVDNVVRPVQG